MPVLLTKGEEATIRKALADRVHLVLKSKDKAPAKRRELKKIGDVMYKLGSKGRAQYQWILEEIDRITDRRGGKR